MSGASGITCPRCQHREASATANFCSRCGCGLHGPACPACAAPSAADDQFCNQCGAGLHPAAGKVAGLGTRVPWAVAALLGVALVVVFVLRGGGGREITLSPPPPGGGGQGAPVTALGPTSAIDLDSMTPRQAASALFNRVMTAVEADDRAQADMFLPMAIASYDRIAALSLDDRFHLSLLHATAGNGDMALAIAEDGLALRPTHLLCLAAAAEGALLVGDRERAARYYRTLLDVYDEESQAGLDEYGQGEDGHARLLPILRADAEAYLSGSS